MQAYYSSFAEFTSLALTKVNAKFDTLTALQNWMKDEG